MGGLNINFDPIRLAVPIIVQNFTQYAAALIKRLADAKYGIRICVLALQKTAWPLSQYLSQHIASALFERFIDPDDLATNVRHDHQVGRPARNTAEALDLVILTTIFRDIPYDCDVSWLLSPLFKKVFCDCKLEPVFSPFNSQWKDDARRLSF